MSKQEFPASWVTTSFGEVFRVSGGSQPPKSTFVFEPTDGYVQLLQIRDFGEKPVPTFVRKDAVSKFCTEDDILIARYGASLGRILTGLAGAYNVALAKVIFDRECIDARYVFYYLKTPFFQTPLKMMSRSAQNGFSEGELRDFVFPLPPLAEQKRIVAKIEELFSELEAGEESLRVARRQLGVYRQSLLKQAFEGHLTAKWRTQNPAALPWRTVSLESISEDISYGYTASSTQENVGPRLLRITDIQDNRVNWADVPFCEIERERKAHYLLKAGDLVFARTGATVGKSFLLKETPPDSVFASYLIRVRCVAGNSMEYLALFFQSHAYWSQITEFSSGIGQPNVNGSKLKKLKLPLCSLPEQQEIVHLLDERFEVIERNEREIDGALRQSEALRQAILQKAFTGRLVPQDPSDEPASALLARLRADRDR